LSKIRNWDTFAKNLVHMSFLKKSLFFLCILIHISAEAATEELDSIHMDAPMLNEIVITSSKDGRKIKDLPASVSVLTLTELGKQNITSIKDISAVIPNLFFPEYGSKLTSPVYIRGIGSKINAPSVGLYVDGIPYFEKSVFDFEFDEVESIEVLRGPQGTLFGRNTMGGIIQVVTKNPLESQGGKISLTGGSFGRKELSASYYGKISPVFGYSFSGKYNHSDGYFVNQYTGKTADKLDAASGSGKLVWKASETLDFKLNVRYDKLNQNGYPYALIDSTGKIGAVNYDSVSSYHREILSGAFVINKAGPGFLLKSVTGIQTLSDLQAIDQDFSVKPTSFVTQRQNQRLWTEELEAHSTGKSLYKWLIGAFAFTQTSLKHIKANTVIKDYDVPTQGLAFYHQSTLKDFLVPGLSLIAGLRYDYEKGSQYYLYKKPVAGVLETMTELNTKLEFSQWSPKLSLQYQFNASNMFYTSVTKGYKTGGFNTSFDTETEQTFKPEYSWNYEIGNKYRLFNRKVSGDLSLFYTDWKNQQISQPLAIGDGSQLRNAGQSYCAGAEFTLQAILLKGWNANLNYGYTQAKFVDYQSGTADFSNKYIPYVPHHTLMIGTDYTCQFNKSYLDKASISCQYIETGKIYWNDNNSASQEAYGTINGKISLIRKNLTLDLWVKNAAASEYTAFYFETSSKKSNGQILIKKFGQKGKPRTLGATLTLLIP